MHSTLQRANHLSSLATTYILVFLALISFASFLALPAVDVGTVEIKDLIVTKGRLRRWGAREEELASLRFSVRTDLTPLLHSYNTKQLFLYLTATYSEPTTGSLHDVVLWDRIITRGDARDFRAVGRKLPKAKGSRGGKARGNVRVEEGKIAYQWRNPSGTFRDVPYANMTLHYSLMPYVGVLSSGVAATAEGPVDIPELLKR